MPVHDWTRVDDGIFHDFHLGWIAELRKALNGGLLPKGYYAMAEQVAGAGNPDLLSLSRPAPQGGYGPGEAPDAGAGGTALVAAPPKTRVVDHAEREIYTSRQRQLVIRHRSGHRVVAMIEIVSAGNKGGVDAWQSFLDKMLAALRQGVHLLTLDVQPCTPRDPDGVHGSLWGRLNGTHYDRPADADRTLAAYSAGVPKSAWVEPIAVGQLLPDMPLFLTPDGHVLVPLEATYQAAYDGVPDFLRDILEAPA